MLSELNSELNCIPELKKNNRNRLCNIIDYNFRRLFFEAPSFIKLKKIYTGF